MNLFEAQKAYENDPMFNALVKMLMAQIIELKLTPVEIRQAALFACIKVQQRKQPETITIDG